MTIRLHHCPQSRSFRSLWLLHEAGLDFELVRHSFFDKSLRSPEFLALSPAGRVPALEIDGRVLFESGAIAEYLCETRAPALWRAPGNAERADWLEWLHYGETAGQHLANLTQHHIVLREEWMRSPTVMRLEARRLAMVLAAVGRATESRDWLLPGGFSAADVQVGYGVVLAQRFIEIDALPGLRAYCDRLCDRPGFKSALAADGPAEIYRQAFYPAPEE